MISVIVPARNEIYLARTVQNILDNARGDIEVLAIADGYVPDPPVPKDKRVRLIHHETAIGQRQSINEAASLALGKHIMKLDAHCAVDEGFDVKLAKECDESWTVVPRMYNLDHVTWLPKRHKRTDYMYISSLNSSDKPFRAMYFDHRVDGVRLHQPNRDAMIDDVMCCMGPGWFMHKSRFLAQGGCDETHGSWGQQGIEVSLKAWLSGGSLKVNKNTWFAHWFRGGGGPGFPYKITGKEVNGARAYSRDLWLNDKWPLATRKFEWLIDKFNPPGWRKDVMNQDELNTVLRAHIHHKGRDPKWRGIKVIKQPQDIALYHQKIWETRPDFIVECGTAFGGATLFFADMLELTGKGHVISIDLHDRGCPDHKRVTCIIGSSTDQRVVDKVKELVGKKSVMVVLDSDHSRNHVKWELFHYSKIATPGQYLVVEDCHGRKGELVGPGEARDWFLRTKRGGEFIQENPENRFLVSFTRGGWLRKR